ncbi:quinate repressor [Fusarium longipes]|uniref:Quinate repressor n=1 Tax=Fusarium longipes TaxID=694270 RepID=A0A395T7H0_9HYPO|nr:quinate repressor [Fusarium longipes]
MLASQQMNGQTTSSTRSSCTPAAGTETPKGLSGYSNAPTPRTPKSRTYSPDTSQRSTDYAPDASIALIGMRGSGLSTLAILASSTLGFRVLDADQYFYKVTGLSRAAYKDAHGISQYRQEELQLMRSMLFDNPTGAIIVCGPGAVEGKGKEWLAEFAKEHLIIYVLRDAEEIQRHLRVFNVDTIKDLIRRAAPAYRRLSNFEYYNISDASLRISNTTPSRGDLSPSALALKNVEEDFLNLIHGIVKRDDSYSKYKAQHSLSSLPLVSRSFTYALSIPLTTLNTMISELRRVDIEADAVELTIPIPTIGKAGRTLDNIIADDISRQISVVRRNICLPIIYQVDTNDTNGTSMNQEEYFGLLEHGLRLRPEYLCVDLKCDTAKIQTLVAFKGHTKIIGHYTASENGDDGWDSPKQWAMVQRAQTLGCDIVRICKKATSLADNFAAKHFAHRVKSTHHYTIPVIAYNTGQLGRTSCYLNSILSPVTHPLVRKLAPECPSSSLLTVQEAQKATFASFLLDDQYFGIYGNNTSQSLSPAMHEAAFKLLGLPHQYNIYTKESVDDLFNMVKDVRFGGASITAPFKTAVIPQMDFLSEEAKAIGAVNTMICLKSPTMDSLLERNTAGPTVALFGENTDWIGIHTCVQRNLSPINAVRRRSTGLIVGGGGMARAAAYAFIRLGIKNIVIHNRTRSRAEEVIEQFKNHVSVTNGQGETDLSTVQKQSESPDRAPATVFRILDSKQDSWPEDLSLPTVVVSCIATKDIDGECSVDTSLPEDWLSSPTGGVVIELADRGWIAVDGLEVLPEQGMMQFELFTTRRAPANTMRQEIKNLISDTVKRGTDLQIHKR